MFREKLSMREAISNSSFPYPNKLFFLARTMKQKSALIFLMRECALLSPIERVGRSGRDP